ncbi:MAG: monovalent cation/H+ antiporter complex subunit F [Candidatus Omnitrophica bacterium]|jgi:multicomponent Na+:H+ antiporter subunit F|nr:monovalent cation/H+ antiporter complex subunit F [Candidatus Omnitrophota bacterium]
MIIFGFIILIICSALCLYRIGRGPTASDRSVAIDILGIIVVAFCVLLYFKTGDGFYLIVAIAWALLSFIGALALAKFLEDKGFDE